MPEHPQRFTPSWRTAEPKRWIVWLAVVMALRFFRADSAADIRRALAFTAVTACIFIAITFVGMSVRLSAEGIHRFGESTIRWSDIVQARCSGFLIRYRATLGEGGRTVDRTRRLNPGVAEAIAHARVLAT